MLLWHFTGPGRHGVDLIVLCPTAERVIAVEVKERSDPGIGRGYRVAS